MKEEPQNFRYLKIFIFLFILIVIVSIVIKFIFVISESSFRNNSFSILYISKKTKVIFVDKESKSVTYLSAGDAGNIIKGKSPFVASIALGVPINGIIYDEDKNLDPNLSDFINFKNEVRLIAGFKVIFKGMNEYDIHKVMSVARGAAKENTKEISVNLLSEKDAKEKLSDAFLDSQIKDSKYTVEIVNGIDVNGLAGSLTSVLTKLGYNVVFLQSVTGTYKDDSYIGFSIEKNDFVSSLIDLTKFETKNKTISPSADVTIYLGSDLESQFNE